MGQPILIAQLQHDILARGQGEAQVRRIFPRGVPLDHVESLLLDDQDHVGLILKLRSLEEDGGPQAQPDSTTTRTMGLMTSAREREGHTLSLLDSSPSLSRRACHARRPMSHKRRLRIMNGSPLSRFASLKAVLSNHPIRFWRPGDRPVSPSSNLAPLIEDQYLSAHRSPCCFPWTLHQKTS